MKKHLAPSLLSANFGHLQSQIDMLTKVGVDIFHIDCMDNHFVPNLTFGPVVIEQLEIKKNVEMDVHLMVTNPASLVKPFIEAGATMISVHVETDNHLQRTLELIKSSGAAAGIVLNPATPLIFAEQALPWCDYILLMSVNPGFASQKYISAVTKKIKQAINIIENSEYNVALEVDGGIKRENLKEVMDAGTDIVVAGSAIYKADNPTKEAKSFLSIIKEYEE